VLRKRRNPYPLRNDINVTFSEYVKEIDRYVPLLSLVELHEWLSDEDGTRTLLDSYETEYLYKTVEGMEVQYY